MLELAHYEWVELALSIDEREPDPASVDPRGDLLDGRPEISPLVWSVQYRFPVHRISPENQPSEPPQSPTHLVIYRNLEMCRLLGRARVILSDVTRGLDRIPMPQLRYDLVFMDPPYDRGFVQNGLKLLRRNPILAPGNCLILEHSSQEPLPFDLEDYVLHDQRRYGKTLVSFLNYVV